MVFLGSNWVSMEKRISKAERSLFSKVGESVYCVMAKSSNRNFAFLNVCVLIPSL